MLQLASIIETRKHADPETSYVASLYAKGLDRILQKLGEEAVETIIAAKGGNLDQVIHETADLWFHSLVMLAHLGSGPDRVLRELERRYGHSGLEEISNREVAKPSG